MSKALLEPVSVIDVNTDTTQPEEGIALCLSGGGYRAMLFHLGALIRLNEIGLLKRLNRVSSVSGGSITAARLGLQWRSLKFSAGIAQNIFELVVDPIRAFGERTIDAQSILGGIFLPGTISDKVANAYRKYLYGNADLQALPSGNEGPRFVSTRQMFRPGPCGVFRGPTWAITKPVEC